LWPPSPTLTPFWLPLSAAGINTVEALAFASKRELAEIKGISDAKVAKIKEAGTFRQVSIRCFIPCSSQTLLVHLSGFCFDAK
jgi:predicted RecB family nuclease